MSKFKLIAFILIITAVVALGTTGFGLLYLESNAATPAGGLTREVTRGIDGSTESATPGEGDDLLRILQNLKNLELNPSVFARPDFLSLVDFSVTLIEQPRGRNNPFAALSSGESYAAPVPAATTSPSRNTPPPAFQVDF